MSKKTKTTAKEQSQEIILKNIVPSSFNPRRVFNEAELIELADSIKEVGVLQPIIVRPLKDKKEMYEIVCGERRYRASLLAEQKTIPAVVKELSDEIALEVAFIENAQREDITPMEEAEFIQILIENKKEDFKSLAKRLGKSEVYVRNRYNLNRLIEPIKDLIRTNKIQIGIGLLLTTYEEDIQNDVFKTFLQEGWNSWLKLSYAEFEKCIKQKYNTILNKANFDISACASCPHNSNFSQLFTDDNAQCLKIDCFKEKQKQAKLSAVDAIIENNPHLDIVKNKYYTNEDILEHLKENDFTINEGDYEFLPEEPTKPKEEDYIYEDELEEEDYQEAIKGYEEELKEYQEELAEFAEKEKNGEITKCLILKGEDLEVGYLLNSDDVSVEKKDSVYDAEIQKIIDKDNRNDEIRVENSIKDIKENIIGRGVDLADKDFLAMEQNLLYYFLLDDLLPNNKEKFLGEDDYYLSKEKKIEIVKNLSNEDKIMIMRNYIIHNLKNCAIGKNTMESNMLIELMEQHFPDETKAILDKHRDIYKKRKKNLDAKKEELELLKEEETQTADI